MKFERPCSASVKIYFYQLLLIFLLVPVPGSAQVQSEKGLPFITNYSPKTYKAFPQTWCVQEDENGIMYFGIQSYILEYDGVKWRKIIIHSEAGTAVVRSMAKHKDGLIYYGGFGDIGYLDDDSLGQKKAISLHDLIPEANRDFLDVWTAQATESGIYFQAREYIFRLDDKKPGSENRKIKVWTPQTKFMYTFYLDNNFYVHQQGLGLYKMTNDSLVLIPGSEFLGKERMQVMLPYSTANNEKRYLVGLFYSGLYIFNGKTFQPFATEADPIIKSGSILYKGLQSKNGNYILSTTGKGLVIVDSQGNLLQKINRDVGLQDESIYGVYEDDKGTLWLALDNGISRVETNSPFTKFSLQSGINTGVLNIIRFEGNLYVGTTNGLLVYNKETSFFDPIPGIPLNQIFSLAPDGKQLLVPGDGLFAIRGKNAYTIRASVSPDLT
ncbi:MAG TPA: two-component regulator propeller domain-containing protein, partial [Cyclobacteriaceae bacterium]|nr:two-component regulator propeller domain-containing protein [Cyclobacteriaceae bacterium]